MNWIKVTDKLPDDDTFVLAYQPTTVEDYIQADKEGFEMDPQENIIQVYFIEGGFVAPSVGEVGFDIFDGVTHWMPLPNPPTAQ